MGLLRLLLGTIIDASGKPSGEDEAHDKRALEDALRKKKLDPSFEQLAGETCRSCKEETAIQKDAQRCPSCETPLHKRCLEKHQRKCGAPASPPYR